MTAQEPGDTLMRHAGESRAVGVILDVMVAAAAGRS